MQSFGTKADLEKLTNSLETQLIFYYIRITNTKEGRKRPLTLVSKNTWNLSDLGGEYWNRLNLRLILQTATYFLTPPHASPCGSLQHGLIAANEMNANIALADCTYATCAHSTSSVPKSS
jgi:hypothetical protein